MNDEQINKMMSRLDNVERAANRKTSIERDYDTAKWAAIWAILPPWIKIPIQIWGIIMGIFLIGIMIRYPEYWVEPVWEVISGFVIWFLWTLPKTLFMLMIG